MAGITRVLTFAEGVSVSAPSQTFLQTNQLQTAADDATFVSDKGSAAADGDIYYDTTLDVIKIYANGAWQVVLDDSDTDNATLSGTQTFSGAKTFSSAVTVSDSTSSTTKDTGSIVTEGGIGIEENLNVGGNATITGDLTVNGTTTTISTTTLDVTDANITVNNGGNQATADSIDAGITVEMSDATDALVHYDSTATSKFKVGESGSTVEIADISSAQVITNKDIDGGTASNTTRITIPKDTTTNIDALTRKEGTILYDTTVKKLKYDDGTNLNEIGGGAGGINHIDNPDAEGGTTDWSTYDDGASATPVDGTAGSATAITFSQNTSSPLRGTADFDIAKSAADGQGEGVSYDFSIDNADKYSIIRVSFDYTTSTNYADADMGVYIYDVTNAALIRLSKEDIDATSLQGHFVSEFQATDSTSYRLILHVNSTNATAYDFNFDNVLVGPRSITRGVVVTDWEDYTPASGWTGSVTHKGKYRRVGDSIELQIATVCTGAPTGTYYTVDLPTGLTIDTAKLNNGINTAQNSFGHAFITDAGTATNRQSGHVYAESTNSLSVIIDESSTVQANSPITFTTNDQVKLVATVPIEGWSSNMTISEDFGGRVITVDAAGNGGTSLTANTTNIDFTTVTDTTGSWDGSVFTAPESGTYVFDGSVRMTSSSTFQLLIYKNGSHYRTADAQNLSSSIKYINAQVDLSKGDTISFRVDTGLTLNNSTLNHFLNIHKISSPQTLIGTGGPYTTYIKDVKSNGTDAGGSTAATNHTRTLNTVTGDATIMGVTLSSNQFTLPAGNYHIEASAPGYIIASHQTYIYNITDSAVESDLIGDTARVNNGGDGQSHSRIQGYLSIATAKTFELRHWTQLTRASDGLGKASSAGNSEIYAQVKITKK